MWTQDGSISQNDSQYSLSVFCMYVEGIIGGKPSQASDLSQYACRVSHVGHISAPC